MHYLTPISGKEVAYVSRGIVVEWSYLKDGVRHWDYAVYSVATTGSLSISTLTEIYVETHGIFLQLRVIGCKDIIVTTEFPGFTEIAPDMYRS